MEVAAVDDDRQRVALDGDIGILVFLLWKIFPSHGNVGFSREVVIFLLLFSFL